MLMLGKRCPTEGHPGPGTSEDLNGDQALLKKEQSDYIDGVNAADFGRLLITRDFFRSAIQVNDHSRIFKGKFMYFHLFHLHFFFKVIVLNVNFGVP